LAQIIEAKREDKPLPEAPEPEAAGGKVLDLMAALNESVAKAQAARGQGPADVHKMPKKKTAAKKTTAKKQPAKKTTEKRTAKKTSGRKPRSS
jgi:DNA end-binding protein Ku